MSKLQGTILASSIVPTDTQDTFATHLAIYGKGGLRTVNDIEERNQIPSLRREEGMLVYVINEKVLYQLNGGITNSNWNIFGENKNSNKRIISFTNKNTVVIYDVDDYQLLNVWVNNDVKKYSLFNEQTFGSQVFNEVFSKGVKKYNNYNAFYDIESNELIVELADTQNGIITII